MSALELALESLPGAPGGGLGPGGAFIGGPPAIGGGGSSGETSAGSEGKSRTFLVPEELWTQELAKKYHRWLTSGGSVGNNALRTVTAVYGLPLLAVVFVLELNVRRPGI